MPACGDADPMVNAAAGVVRSPFREVNSITGVPLSFFLSSDYA
jgi:hypothetical protein